MTTDRIPDGTIQRILEDERSPIRFEQFCCDLFTAVDGIEYVGTSRSWDLGRDGRTLPLADGRCGYLCCTTGTDLDDKAEADLRRLLGFAQPEKVYFCTTQAESENALQQVEGSLRELVEMDTPLVL